MCINTNDLPEGYDFVHVPLSFTQERYVSVFAEKNNKTLAETLKHSRYAKFEPVVLERYADYLNQPLGQLLLEVKQLGDTFYRSFLNKYGDLEYSNFSISDAEFFQLRGIYAYHDGYNLKYIGRCLDQMKKRINQGYGKIHPKNCYLDGQATNCHLNSKITSHKGAVSLWLCKMDDLDGIKEIEGRLIQENDPPWNLRR